MQFSSQYPPTVHVRPASSEEAKIITQFPGKKEPGLLNWTNLVVGLSLHPIVTPFLLPMAMVVDHQERNDPGLKRVLAEFPSRLQEAIEQRLSGSSSGESSDLLEVVYFAGLSGFWSPLASGEDPGCFVMHAQVTLQSKEEEVFRDIIRIDPRAYNSDIQKPHSFQYSYEIILNYANETIPKMIEIRLPGLPWKSKELKENDKLPD